MADPAPVEGVLLVGGLGTRLRPLTVYTPKPMLPVAGVPFVLHQLARLRDAGVTHVVLATSYRAEVFEGCLGDGRTFGLELEYATEDEPLGTGGAIRERRRPAAVRARRPGRGPQRRRPVRARRRRADRAGTADAGADVTLHLVRVDDARAYGCVPTDPSGRVTRVPGEDARAGHRPGQRRLLRLPPVGARRDPRRPGGVGRARDLPRTARARRPGPGRASTTSYWLDLGHSRGVRDRVARPGARGGALLGRARTAGGVARCCPAPSSSPARWSTAAASSGPAPGWWPAPWCDGSVLQDGAVVAAGARGRRVRRRLGGPVWASGPVVERAVVGDDAVVGADCELAPGSPGLGRRHAAGPVGA